MSGGKRDRVCLSRVTWLNYLGEVENCWTFYRKRRGTRTVQGFKLGHTILYIEVSYTGWSRAYGWAAYQTDGYLHVGVLMNSPIHKLPLLLGSNSPSRDNLSHAWRLLLLLSLSGRFDQFFTISASIKSRMYYCMSTVSQGCSRHQIVFSTHSQSLDFFGIFGIQVYFCQWTGRANGNHSVDIPVSRWRAGGSQGYHIAIHATGRLGADRQQRFTGSKTARRREMFGVVKEVAFKKKPRYHASDNSWYYILEFTEWTASYLFSWAADIRMSEG